MKLHRQSVPVLRLLRFLSTVRKTVINSRPCLTSWVIDQPAWKELTKPGRHGKFVNKVGYPVLINPSILTPWALP